MNKKSKIKNAIRWVLITEHQRECCVRTLHDLMTKVLHSNSLAAAHYHDSLSSALSACLAYRDAMNVFLKLNGDLRVCDSPGVDELFSKMKEEKKKLLELAAIVRAYKWPKFLSGG